MGEFFQTVDLWPTRLGFYWTAELAGAAAAVCDESLRRAVVADGPTRTSSERRVRHILDGFEAGIAVREELRQAARQFLGEPWGTMLDPDYCENRTLIIEPGGFISTHKDSREGDLTCVLFLTGGGDGQPINSVGDPRFVVEDPSRYFDEGRLPYEERHGYSVNPRPGLAVFFPSHVPHNQHPFTGTGIHMQVVANFRVDIPADLEEELFD